MYSQGTPSHLTTCNGILEYYTALMKTTVICFHLSTGPSTRIILLSLALCDLIVLTIHLFLGSNPYYWHWFEVYSSDLSCGITWMVHTGVRAASCWYIVLLTAERFIVIWFPFKVTASAMNLIEPG